MTHTEESLMSLAYEWADAPNGSTNEWKAVHALQNAIREVLVEKQKAALDALSAYGQAEENLDRAEKAEAECERLRTLLQRARWFVKQENDACLIACAEDPNYCCADTLTAIDAALKDQP